MVKLHNIKLTIENESGIDMIFDQDWFQSGRVADGFKWPEKIVNGDHQTILCYEKDWSAAGCSGYTQYKMADKVVTIAFSNPDVGTNNLNIGTDGMSVWETMNYHDYQPFIVDIIIDETPLICKCKCSGSKDNKATVTLTTLSHDL